jgi:hypothetical protein
VRRGRKREFRVPVGTASYQHWRVDCPTAVVAFTRRRHGPQPEPLLMVLEAVWQEQLMAISPESLAAEGCANFREFRSKWIKRTKRLFEPLRLVWVFRVRPFEEDDRAMLGDRLFERLYGSYVP